ncbi:MAG: HAMP domain-containing histidine kinase [Clostridiales bacterium]|nr:HAMP domain-containing histidine kinase [Clostridiales bacterium]
MIKTLQRRLIAIAMASMAFVLALIIAAINIANWISVNQTLDERMEMLADRESDIISNSGGTLEDNAGLPSDAPDLPGEQADSTESIEDSKSSSHSGSGTNGGKRTNNTLSAEAEYDTRYFTVTLNDDGSIYTIDTSSISAITSDDAADYAASLFAKGKEKGYMGIYKYTTMTVYRNNGHDLSSATARTMYIFMDCERELGTLRSYFLASIGISLLGLLLVFIMVVLFSHRAMEPIRESYAKQKQFITDAGHEIKTPLTIIDANTEILEMMEGENEWTISTRNQIARLTALTEKMVYLSRMDEDNTKLQMLDFSLSDAILETADPFAAVARTRGLTFEIDVEPNVSYHGEEASIRQVVSILLDNSMKYASENGSVRICLKTSGRSRKLTVWNTVSDIEPGSHEEFFDRFYRRDSSRSQDIKGHGIGLSVALAIVKAHGGKLTAKSEDSESITFIATL